MKKQLSLNNQALIIGSIQGEVQDSFSAQGHRVILQHQPTDLEPAYHPFTLNTLSGDLPSFNLQQRPDSRKAIRVVYMRLWFPQENKTNWREVDFLRELSQVKNPVNFLILGNKAEIMHIIGAAPNDESIAKNILKAKFPDIECDSGIDPFVNFSDILKASSSKCFALRDYYPQPPAYWRILSFDENSKSSPLISLYAGLSSLGENELGIYQVIVKPTVYPWAKNILSLIEVEAEISKYERINLSRWYYPGFGSKEKNKSKLDSPIMAVAVRNAIISESANTDSALNALSLAFSNFQFSGENLNYLDKTDYKNIIRTIPELISWIAAGIVYRSGFLLNTREAMGFFHLPTGEVSKNENYRIDRITGFRVPQELRGVDGVDLGYSDYTGERVIVTQPENIRPSHTSVEAVINQGKSCLLSSMCLDDSYKGKGVGFIDLHGDAIDAITKLIPEKRIKDVVYFDPCDDEFALCYNSFALRAGEDIGKKVDDLVVSVRSLYSGKDWGNQIESILSSVFYTLLRGKDLTLSDARILLSKTKEGYRLRESLLPLIDNQEVRLFWTDLFERLPIQTIQRVVNKLSKFLLPAKVNRIFSQRKNLINFRNIIDEGKIFLGYLPVGKLGSDCANVLGSTVVSDFYNAGMSRQNIPFAERRPYNLYIDECQRISVKSFEDSLRELRKYNVRLILAYQQKEQLDESIRLAMGNVGTVIKLGLDWDSAQRAFKEFSGQIEPNDFMRRETGDGYVKMFNHILSLKTFPPKEIKGNGFRDEIIKYSHKHYYVPVVHNKVDSRSLPKAKTRNNNRIVYDEI